MNNKIFRFFLLAGLMLLSLGASAQSKVTGKVVDANGEEIIGATVGKLVQRMPPLLTSTVTMQSRLDRMRL